MFENIRADFSAHGRDWGAQGFWAMLVYRFGRWRYGVRPAPCCASCSPWSTSVLYKGVQIVTGIELPCEVPVGKRLRHRALRAASWSAASHASATHCRIRNGVVVGLAHVRNSPARRCSATTSTSARAPRCWVPSASATTCDIGANAVVRAPTCRTTASLSACRPSSSLDAPDAPGHPLPIPTSAGFAPSLNGGALHRPGTPATSTRHRAE
jgi:serine O-acetyltransferase